MGSTAETGKAKEVLEKFVERKGIRKWFKRDNLIILVLSGILLLIIALPTKGPGKSGAGDAGQGTAGTKTVLDGGGASGGARSQSAGGANASGGANTSGAEGSGSSGGAYAGGTAGSSSGYTAGEDYAGYLEEKLRQTLSGMAGVGRVSVMITLASSEELVVEKDEPVSRTNTTDSDSSGGSRSIYEVENKPQTIYRTQSSDSEPFVVKTLLPRVEGVVVVAEGAGTGSVSKSITEVVQALFDLEANKIKVVKKGTE